jgi:GTP diphosphokinase / guanosine-3',5'-bis(diphosphate) 3'-diphosphatase
MFPWSKKKNSKIINQNTELGVSPEKDLELLLAVCKENLDDYNPELIKKAFRWCYDTHKNKVRHSGRPYYTHPLSVALIVLTEMPLDDISVVCALLHNVVDEGDTFGIKDIYSEFGSTIGEIVENIVKIKKVENKRLANLENYRKLLLSLFKDVRIILVKIADRLHNMRTLDYVDSDKQIQLAKETIEIFAPFANRFGLGSLKWELEDLSFKYLDPEAYDEIKANLQLSREEREEYVKNFVEPIRENLTKDPMLKKKSVKFEIYGRPKHIYSIYNKMIIRNLPMDELMDLFAVRIILETPDSHFCFLVYSIVSDLYRPVPGTFKDYISNPKKNGYQSIHTAMIGNENRPVEVQIRTRKMHKIAEKGVAAHFQYKRGFIPAQSVFDNEYIDQWMGTVRSIFENAGEEHPEQMVDNLKKNLFNDEIYVFTPANEFRICPKDSTPIDFAYLIHTDIGDHSIGAKVNGKIEPLDHKLRNGDIVEILTSKRQEPSQDWLSFVVTQRARNQIHKYLKKERKKEIDEGMELWAEISDKMNLEVGERDLAQQIHSLDFDSLDDFYYALGTATIGKEMIYSFVKEKFDDIKVDDSIADFSRKVSEEYLSRQENGTENNEALESLKDPNINVEFSKCCNPLPDCEIIGMVRKHDDIAIHRRDCQELAGMVVPGNPAVFKLSWNSVKEKSLSITIMLTGEDRDNLLSDVMGILSQISGVIIQGINFSVEGGEYEGKIDLKLNSIVLFTEIVGEIMQLDKVDKVIRI